MAKHGKVRIAVRIAALAFGGYLYLCLAYLIAGLIFYALVARFGPEFFVGAENVVHDDNGGCWYTNPDAILFWHGLIMLAEFALTVLIVWIAVRRRKRRHDFEEQS